MKQQVLNRALREEILQRVWNEYTLPKSQLEDLLTQTGVSESKANLLRAILKSCSWYQLIAILSKDELRVALSDDVISKLWPKSLQKRFKYAASLLFPDTISTSG